MVKDSMQYDHSSWSTSCCTTNKTRPDHDQKPRDDERQSSCDDQCKGLPTYRSVSNDCNSQCAQAGKRNRGCTEGPQKLFQSRPWQQQSSGDPIFQEVKPSLGGGGVEISRRSHPSAGMQEDITSTQVREPLHCSAENL